jgi:hypothetical protein
VDRRGPLKRTKGLARTRKRPTVADRLLDPGSGAFYAAAAAQDSCAACGRRGPFQAHHVVEKKHLTDGLYPPDDALRICATHVRPCHFDHHYAGKRIATRRLTDANVAFAFSVLGAYAQDYLRRYYDDSDPDPRIARHAAAYPAA